MSAYRNESVYKSDTGDFIMVLFIILVILSLGAIIVRYIHDTEIMFYKKTYIPLTMNVFPNYPEIKVVNMFL